MSDPITLISGFGRCGSSLTMQMLAAGGMRVAGKAPAFECEEARPTRADFAPIDTAWLERHRGAAIKLLDPHRFLLPRSDYRVVWLNRNLREQARSQCKFATMLLGVPTDRHTRKLFERSYAEDRPKALAALRRAGAEILQIDFEDLIGAERETTALSLAEFIARPLDIDRMLAAVLPRGPECRPDLAIELSLIAREGR